MLLQHRICNTTSAIQSSILSSILLQYHPSSSNTAHYHPVLQSSIPHRNCSTLVFATIHTNTDSGIVINCKLNGTDSLRLKLFCSNIFVVILNVIRYSIAKYCTSTFLIFLEINLSFSRSPLYIDNCTVTSWNLHWKSPQVQNHSMLPIHSNSISQSFLYLMYGKFPWIESCTGVLNKWNNFMFPIHSI